MSLQTSPSFALPLAADWERDGRPRIGPRPQPHGQDLPYHRLSIAMSLTSIFRYEPIPESSFFLYLLCVGVILHCCHVSSQTYAVAGVRVPPTSIFPVVVLKFGTQATLQP